MSAPSDGSVAVPWWRYQLMPGDDTFIFLSVFVFVTTVAGAAALAQVAAVAYALGWWLA